MADFDPDMVFWKAVEAAKELLLNSELLKKTKMDIPAERAVLKAAVLLMLVAPDKKAVTLHPELKELCEKFRQSSNPFERMDLLDKIKNYGD
jgi:hypothetical protein